MRQLIAALVVCILGCACVTAEEHGGGPTHDAGVVADSGAERDAGQAGDDGGGDAGGSADSGHPADPHVCDRVVSVDGGRYCLSLNDVTAEFFAVAPDAAYLNVRGSRGDGAFVVVFGASRDGGAVEERTRAGKWDESWHVEYFPVDPRAVSPSETDEHGSLCDCETVGSPQTGYSCRPRVWLSDGGQYLSTGMGPCVSMSGETWASNSGYTWLHLRSSQTRLVPKDGGLGWDRVHVAHGGVVLSGSTSAGYESVVLGFDGGRVRTLAVEPPGSAAEAVKVSRSGMIVGWIHESLAHSRPVVWPRLGADGSFEVAMPDPSNARGFAYTGVAADEGFCATQDQHAVLYLGVGAPPLVDDDLGLPTSNCTAALTGGRFLLIEQGGGPRAVTLLRLSRCSDNCE